MKNKSILLVLPALTLICSCSSEPGSDYKEIDATTAKAQAKKIEENVESDTFELPKKVNYTFSTASSGKDKDGESGINLKGSSNLDLEQKYVHFYLEGDIGFLEEKTGKIEGWSYIKDNQFVCAVATDNSKSYSVVSVEDGEKDFDSFVKEASLDTETVSEIAKKVIEEISTYASLNYNVEIGGVKSEAKFYKGSGDGDLKLEYKSSLESSSYSYNEEGKLVFGSFLPTYAYSKKTGNVSGAAFSFESKTQFDWNKCDVKYPNLNDFTSSNNN